MNIVNVIVENGVITLDTDATSIPTKVVEKLVNELYKEIINKNKGNSITKLDNSNEILVHKCKFYKTLALISNIVLLTYAILRIIL